MRTLAGPDASIAFTHLSRSASASLSAALNPPAPSSSSSPDPASPAPAHAECHEQGVLSLRQARNISLEHVCLLDPKAPTALTPADGDGDAASKFVWFLFGVRILRSPFLPKPFRPLTTPLYSFGRVGWLVFFFFFVIG
jgi:Predicted SAM-dependent RNA methyltransferase